MSGVGLGGVATILGAYYENEKKKARTGRFYIYMYRVGKIVKIAHQAEEEHEQKEHDKF